MQLLFKNILESFLRVQKKRMSGDHVVIYLLAPVASKTLGSTYVKEMGL